MASISTSGVIKLRLLNFVTKAGRKAPAFRPGDISPWPDRAKIFKSTGFCVRLFLQADSFENRKWSHFCRRACEHEEAARVLLCKNT